MVFTLDCSIRRGLLLALVVSSTLIARAHTLPISFLTIFCDADYAHLELRLNPFELSFFSELDRNNDQRLDPTELQPHDRELAAKISACLKLQIGQRTVTPETVGFTPEADGHHMIFGAHYRVEGQTKPLSIESSLASITSGSHLTQVTLLRGGQRQLAQLNAHSPQATFISSAQPRILAPQAGQHAPSPRLPTLLQAIGFSASVILALIAAVLLQPHPSKNAFRVHKPL